MSFYPPAALRQAKISLARANAPCQLQTCSTCVNFTWLIHLKTKNRCNHSLNLKALLPGQFSLIRTAMESRWTERSCEFFSAAASQLPTLLAPPPPSSRKTPHAVTMCHCCGSAVMMRARSEQRHHPPHSPLMWLVSYGQGGPLAGNGKTLKSSAGGQCGGGGLGGVDFYIPPFAMSLWPPLAFRKATPGKCDMSHVAEGDKSLNNAAFCWSSMIIFFFFSFVWNCVIAFSPTGNGRQKMKMQDMYILKK